MKYMKLCDLEIGDKVEFKTLNCYLANRVLTINNIKINEKLNWITLYFKEDKEVPFTFDINSLNIFNIVELSK